MVKKMMDKFMVRGNNYPMQSLLNLRARCLRINKQRMAEVVVNWVEDKVFYKDISVDMGQVRIMVGNLIGQARGILVKELLLLAGDGNGKTTFGGRAKTCRVAN